MTLVELLIALFVLGVGILALAAVQIRSGTVVHATGTETRAMAVCQAQLETARAAGFGAVQPDTGQAGALTWITEVTAENATMDRVRVTVSWTESGGQARALSLNTFLSER